MLELYRAVRMFSGAVPPGGHYEVKEHLAEIVNLFGPFPDEFLKKGDQELVREILTMRDELRADLQRRGHSCPRIASCLVWIKKLGTSSPPGCARR